MFLQFQDEDEVPDDETLNQMIARNEDEFELYMVLKKSLFLSRANSKYKISVICNKAVKLMTDVVPPLPE